MIALILLSLIAGRTVLFGAFSRRVWAFYILPGLFVYSALLVNFSLNALGNLGIVGHFGLLIPWAAYLAIPTFMRRREIDARGLWRHYYYFMCAASILGGVEYLLASAGQLPLRLLTTPNGIFLAGRFSLLHGIGGGLVHDRLYACLPEPGTLAMFLLPAIAYAYFHRRVGGLTLFLVALFATRSLGGMIGLFMLGITTSFLTARTRRSLVIPLAVMILVAVTLWASFGSSLVTQYESRGNSQTQRVYNTVRVLAELPNIIVANPLGFDLAEDTEQAFRNQYFYGTNFAPGNALYAGGLLALVGYVATLVVAVGVSFIQLARAPTSPIEKAVYSSLIVLLPFIFQRTTVWDSALFAFLFAPALVAYFARSPPTQELPSEDGSRSLQRSRN